MKLISILLILLILFWGCKKKNKESVTNTVDSQRVVDSMKLVEDSNKRYHDSFLAHYDSIEKTVMEFALKNGIPSADTISFKTKQINIDILQKRNIKINNPIKIDTVLYKLFPGNIYSVRDGREIIYTVFWENLKNKKNKRTPSAYIGEEFDISFPDTLGWETRFEDSFSYKVNGIKHFAFFFSSFQSQYDMIRAGRFSCAIYGVAVFKSKGAYWQLEKFNPAIGCFGMFGSPQKPKIIQLGPNEYGFTLLNGFTAPGGPIYNNLHVFRFNENIAPVLFIEDIERSYAIWSHWNTSITPIKSKGSLYNLSLSTKGYYFAYDVDSFCIENRHLDTNLYQLLDGNNYSFNQKRIFTFKNGKYILTKDDFDFKKTPMIDTAEGNPYDY